jgi:small-conductance mechanosensitive channel
MDITVRKSYASLDKITKKSTKHTFLISGYFLFLFAFIAARFILKDENLRILGSLAYKEILQKISLGGVFTCLILIIVKWVERLVVRKSKMQEHYNLVRALRLISILLIALVIISILFVNWYAAAVSFGVISLILSFSLQTPLTSLIAWAYILARSPYRVGDRIKINSFKGDVVEINYMDTTLWEMGGDYLTNDVPSGKLIRFPNSLVLQNAIFNYSWKKFPYIWNEVSVYVPYKSDLDFVEKVMNEITVRELGAEQVKRIKEFKEDVERTSVDEEGIKEHPVVSFNIKGETWIQATVTYAVEPKLAGELRSRLIKKIMKELKIMPE